MYDEAKTYIKYVHNVVVVSLGLVMVNFGM